MFEALFSENGLSFDRLKNFCAVAENGGITAACEGNPARQPLISRQIKELEVYFGAELIRRKGKGIELTTAGRLLARQIRLQFQGLEDFRASCTQLPREFRIATGNSVLEWLLVPCMQEVANAIPGSTFQFLDWRTDDVIKGLLDHTVDFGIVRKSSIVPPIKFSPLGKFGYRLFVPRKLLKEGKPYNQSIPVAIAIGGEFLRHLAEATRKSKSPPNIIFRCTSFTQAAQLARCGIAAAVLPEIAGPSLSDLASVVEVPWLQKFERDLGLAWNERLVNTRNKAVDLRDALQSSLLSSLSKRK